MATQNLRAALALLAQLEGAELPEEAWFFLDAHPLALKTCLSLRWIEPKEGGYVLTDRGRRALGGLRRALALGLRQG